MLSRRKSRKSAQVRPSRVSYGASVEVFEKRELLTVAPFLQGTAFVDVSGTGSLTRADTPLAGATISVYQGTTVSPSTFLESTVTDANGQYLFVPGNSDGPAVPTAGDTYTIVESAAPSGYSVNSTQAFSELDQVVGTTSKSITVTVAPAEVQTTFGSAYSFSNAVGYSINGVQEPGNYGTPFTMSLSLVPGTSGTVNGSGFQTFCVDPPDDLGGAAFTVATDPTGSLINGGEIGYLFNQYGTSIPTTSSLPSSIQALSGFTSSDVEAGLQTAIWELEYPAVGSNSGFALDSSSTTDYALVNAIANAFVAEAQSATPEQVGILDASLTGSLPHSAAGSGEQSVLVGDSLNFGNVQNTPATGTITGTDFVVPNSTTAGSLAGLTSGVVVAGTPVSIYASGSSTPYATTTTDASGNYRFTGVPLGTYTVSESAPSGYTHLGQSAPTVSLTTTSLSATDNFYETASVSVNGSDYLISSTTTPTTSTTGAPIAGTTITLTGTDEFGNTVNISVTTGSNGAYSFTGLNPSNAAGYTVTETVPSAYAHQGQSSTTTGSVFSVTGTPSKVSQVVLGTNGSSSTDNFFEYGATISGSVYADNNANNTDDSGDNGLGGVTVFLYNSTGTAVVATTTSTSPYGTYSLTNVPAGNYIISEIAPSGYTGESPTVGSSGGTSVFASSVNLELITGVNLGAGVNDTNNNFGQYQAVSVSGTVYNDANGNDKLDTGDNGLGGVTVYLYNTSGVAATTITASNGTYHFTSNANGSPLAPGLYAVQEIVPSGEVVELANLGTAGGTAQYGSSGAFTLTTGTAATGYNFPQYLPSTVSGTVYVDANANDTLDSGETGLGGITVTLQNSAGSTIATTTSASNGTYSFTGIAPGSYSIQEGSTPGYTRENANPGTSGGTPWWGAITGFGITSGTNDTGNNFGQYVSSSISGTVYVDASGSGLTAANQPPANSGDTGEAGVTVKLTNSAGSVIATTTTAADGTYAFNGVPIGTYTVSEVIPAGTYQTGPNTVNYQITTSVASPTSTNDNFANYMACNMSGLSNVKYYVNGTQVSSLDSAGNLQGDTITVTFDNTGTSPIMLSLADYESAYPYFTIYNVSQQVLVGDSSGTFAPGKGYSLTVTEPNSYYQVDFVCGAAIVHFGPGGSNVDYGEEGRFIAGTIGGSNAYSTSSLSGTVYVDANGNGSLDSGETGLANVPVTLTGTTYVGANLVGTSLTPITVTATTMTNATGGYTFTGLAPGIYSVTETQPSSYTSETANVGTAGGKAIVGSVSAIALNSNTAATNYNFGQYQATGTISGTVYSDNNRNDSLDSSDSGIGGVQVFLYNSTGTARLATVTTASNGTYSFTGLAPGSYIVAEFAPSGYTGETPNAGLGGGTSLFNSSTTLATINSITVASAANESGNNFGNLPACAASLCGIVYADINCNDLYNCGIDYGQAGVTVTLTGTSIYGNTCTYTTTTNSTGNYSFQNIICGNYTISESGVSNWTPESSNIGNAGGVIGLTSTSGVNLTSGAADSGYNFGSKVNNCGLGNYQTCSTNYWCGSTGQSLINCMNGGSSSTKLGTWLSSMLPNICGSFAGKTNAQVCSSFQSLCLTNSCNANIVSTAIAAYCTNTSLAGCSTAANYGFGLVTGGSGNCTVNLGNTFAGFGGPCGTTSLFNLLSFANNQCSSWSSWNFFGWGQSSQSSVNSWFSSINGCSKIG